MPPDHIYINDVRYEPVDTGPGCLQGIAGAMIVLFAAIGFIGWQISRFIQSNYQSIVWCMFGFVSFVILYSVVRLLINEHLEQPPVFKKLFSLCGGFMVAAIVGMGVGLAEVIMFFIFAEKTATGINPTLGGYAGCIYILLILGLHGAGGVTTKLITKRTLLGGLSSLCAEASLVLVFVYLTHLWLLTYVLSVPALLLIILAWFASIIGAVLAGE